jgi:hypothetical protein
MTFTDDQLAALSAVGLDPSQIILKGEGMPGSQSVADGGLQADGAKDIDKSKKKKVEEDDEDDDGNGDDAAMKSQGVEFIDADDLVKSLDGLTAATQSREQQLADGFAKGSLNDDERKELSALLGGAEVKKSLTDQMADDGQLAQDYDVYPYLQRVSEMMASAVDALDARVQKSDERQTSFNGALAKSLVALGKLVAGQQALNKSLLERLTVVESTPLPRKGVVAASQAKVLQKAGTSPNLSPDQIRDGFSRLMVKSRNNNYVAPCGEALDVATAMYESANQISRGMYADIVNVLQESAA